MTKESSAEPGDETAPPAVARRSSGAGKVIVLLLVLLLAVGGWASFPLWREMAGFPAPVDEMVAVRAALENLSDRQGRLETSLNPPGEGGVLGRLATLEQKMAATETQPQLTEQLAADVASLNRQLAELRRNTLDGAAVARLPAEVEALTRQVETLQKSAADAATMLKLYERVDQTQATVRDLQTRHASSAGLLLAVGQLRETVDRGAPFDAQWRAVKVLAGEDAEILAALEVLRPRADSGIPTRGRLIGRFEHLAAEIVRAEFLPEEEGWTRRAADRMLSLVSIRREAGVVAGNDAASIVARAESALGHDDLPAALTETESLVYGPAEAAAPWIADVKARLAADKALSDLVAQSVALAGARP